MGERTDPHEDLGYSRNPREIEPARDEATRQRKAAELGLPSGASWWAINKAELAVNRPPEPGPAEKSVPPVDEPMLKSRSQVDLAEANRAESEGFEEAGGDAAFGGIQEAEDGD